MRLHPAMSNSERKLLALSRRDTLDPHRRRAREVLVAKELRPGDFLGTEKDLAQRFKVSRIVARDALRTLEAQGIVEIKVGAGGGARIAQGNARLFAEALAVQLDLTGVSVAEIMEAQRAIERLAVELRRRPLDGRGSRALARLIADAQRSIATVGGYTRLGREFHLAVAEASHNRVLVVATRIAAACLLAGAESDAHARGGAPHSGHPQGIDLAHRDARRRRRAPTDGRAREDDRRAAHCGASRAAAPQRVCC